jgi:hypothetical protein
MTHLTYYRWLVSGDLRGCKLGVAKRLGSLALFLCNVTAERASTIIRFGIAH